MFALPSLGSMLSKGREGDSHTYAIPYTLAILYMRKGTCRRGFGGEQILSEKDGLERTAKAEKGLQRCAGRRIAVHIPLQGEEKPQLYNRYMLSMAREIR